MISSTNALMERRVGQNILAEIPEPIYQPKSLRTLCGEFINNGMGARYEPKVKKDVGIDVQSILKVDPVTLPPLIREIRALPLENKEGKFKQFSEQCRFEGKPEDSTWERFFSSRAFEPQIRERISHDLAEMLDDDLRNELDDIGLLISRSQNYPPERKESVYRELSEKCRFTNKAPDVLWETFFNLNAANWIVTNHPEVVAAVKTSFEEYQEEHRNIIQNIFFAAVDGLVNYIRDLKVTFQLISSDIMNKCTLGTDVFIYKTVLHIPIVLTALLGSVCVVAAIAAPFFASSLGIIGVGAILGEVAKCVVGALIEFGFAGLNHFFLRLIWSDELALFEPYANEYRMKIFIENQLKSGLNDLRMALAPDVWSQFRQTFSGMAAAGA